MARVRICDICGKLIKHYYHVQKMCLGDHGGRPVTKLSAPAGGSPTPTEWDLCEDCYPLLPAKIKEGGK